MESNIHIYPTQAETAKALADFLTGEINKTLSERGEFSIALSGGSTPKSLFTVLADNYINSVNWSSVRFFWVDERCVPPDNPESNYRLANESFLGKLKIPLNCIHRILGESDPDKESKRYADEIRRNVRLINSFPSFDFILLGMGEDGHTASIFPGSEYLFSVDEFCAAAIHPESQQNRVTITGKVINNARNVVVFATGQNKSAIINEVVSTKPYGKLYPVSLVSPVHGNLNWYIDKEAANLLHLRS